MTVRLMAFAAAFLARLSFILFSLSEARAWTPVIVLAFALVTAWIPFRRLGLPGDYVEVGGEP